MQLARTLSLAAPLALGAALIAAPMALADPNPDLTPARSFILDCGADGSYSVVFVESNLGTFHVTGDSRSIFQSTSLTIEGVLIFSEPGFGQNERPELTCTFVGASTGRHFMVTGFFTPPGH